MKTHRTDMRDAFRGLAVADLGGVRGVQLNPPFGRQLYIFTDGYMQASNTIAEKTTAQSRLCCTNSGIISFLVTSASS